MKATATDYTKLGLFVLAGLLFLILMLYMIGRNRNLFSSTFTLKAAVTHVNGLVAGNNVRYRGIDVGTVRSIEVANDTSVLISLHINNSIRPFIKKNALASIGTDGLMGNKLLNILPQPGLAEPVEDGDILYSQRPPETEEMLRTLQLTNNNLLQISQNLYSVSDKLNNSNTFWSLLADSTLANELKLGMADFRKTAANTAEISTIATRYAHQLNNKNSLAYKLFTDSTYALQVASSLEEIQAATRQASSTAAELKTVITDLKEGEGTAGMLLSDTLLRNSLMRTVLHVEEGTNNFNKSIEALNNSFLFRGYFRRQEKQKQEAQKNLSKSYESTLKAEE